MYKLKLLWVITLSLPVWFTGCEDNKDNPEVKALAPSVLTVTPDTASLRIGDTLILAPALVPEKSHAAPFTYVSNATDVVTVSPQGVITALTMGNAVVTVSSGALSKTVPVTVDGIGVIKTKAHTYEVVTLNNEELAPGVKWFKLSLPEFTNTVTKGLVINVVIADLSNPDNMLEVVPQLPATLNNVERPTVMYTRRVAELSASGRKPVAITNGDYFANGGTVRYEYLRNNPYGIEITNGMLTHTPWFTAFGAYVGDNNTVRIGNFTFSGTVESGGQTFTLSEVNGYARDLLNGDPVVESLTLFNNKSNSYPTDSAFAWSPRVSSMVSLSHPVNGWRVNDPMEFTVTGIEHNITTAIPAAKPGSGGKNFNGEGAILVGDGAAKTFLQTLSVGKKVNIALNVKYNDTPLQDKKMNAVGTPTNPHLLNAGVPIDETHDNGADPRTLLGHYKDGKKVVLCVIDGRRPGYSAGVLLSEAGYIMKALGCDSSIGLDGGGSSVMVVNGEVKNRPSDNAVRAVANGVMITVKK
jgi:exopolysaccharide biosynthesis protein